ncbi:hypothetical protein WJX84_006395, partial [Apatococcus fuscideae]
MQTVTRDMLRYVRNDCKGQDGHSLDVLNSGLKSVNAANGATGVDKGRLLLARAEVHFDRGQWGHCLDSAAEARAAAGWPESKDSLAISSEAFSMGTRALLASGRTQAAHQLAQEAEELMGGAASEMGITGSAGVAAAGSLVGLALHAAGD